MQGKQEQFYREKLLKDASALAKTINREDISTKTEKLASKRKVSPQLQNIQDKLSD